MDILTRLLPGDILKFRNADGKARFRKVLSADGVGPCRVYNLSSAGKNLTSSHLAKSFTWLTAAELASKGYVLNS